MIYHIHHALSGVEILDLDFEKAVQRAKGGDFIYFDPPYHPLTPTSNFVSYTGVFSDSDQLRLFEVFKYLDSINVKLMQTNSNTTFIRELYKDFRILEIEAKRSINCHGSKRGEITDLLILGNYYFICFTS